jgi:hypothetical protein
MSDDAPDPLPPEYLSVVSTQALIDELRARSEVFFCCLRPQVTKDYQRQWSWGGKTGNLERVLGLIELSKHDMIQDIRDGDDVDETPPNPFAS